MFHLFNIIVIIIDLSLILLQHCRTDMLRNIKPSYPIVAREVDYEQNG